jgi:hypothetical protein
MPESGQEQIAQEVERTVDQSFASGRFRFSAVASDRHAPGHPVARCVSEIDPLEGLIALRLLLARCLRRCARTVSAHDFLM